MSNKERLQKVIAASGYTSRRKAETLILENKVKVDGKVVNELGTRVSPNAIIHVNGVLISKEEKVYYVINKPKNVLSSVSDDRNRPVIVDYIAEERRVYPVGRLDYDTTGLLMLTNDGNFTNAMIHPSFNIEKVYDAVLDNIVTVAMIKQLEAGVMLDDYKTMPAKVKVLRHDKKRKMSNVRITISEGRNRQVKRMFEAVGVNVVRLHRRSFGFLTLEGLDIGEYRRIKPFEVINLMKLANEGLEK